MSKKKARDLVVGDVVIISPYWDTSMTEAQEFKIDLLRFSANSGGERVHIFSDGRWVKTIRASQPIQIA